MNTKIVTTSVRRMFFALICATLLLSAATLGQVWLASATGVNWVATAYACPGSGGGGGC